MTLLRTVLGALLFLSAAALVLWLVYSNSQPLALHLVGLWGGEGVPNPFARAGQSPDLLLPFGFWLLIFTMFGVVIGLFTGWFIAGSTRIQMRQQARRARQAEAALEAAEKEAETAKQQLDEAKNAAREKKPSLELEALPEVKRLT